MSRRDIVRTVVLFVALFLVVIPSDARKPQAPKYVFFMIGDGMGINHVRATELYNQAMSCGPESINFFDFPFRTFVTTHSASSLVTDSAAAGTALASGFKTANGRIGMNTAGDAPVSNILEWAKACGYATGVATTVGVNHATPAAFLAHVASRTSMIDISDQIIASEAAQFVAGSGFLIDKGVKIKPQVYEQKAKDAGITILYGVDQMKKAASVKGRLFCLPEVPADDLPYEVDRKAGETKLAEFVKAGVDYLYNQSKKGFVFMVEGGSIDHGAHNNDAVCTFHEINDFAEAIDVALAFYNEHPKETLIVVTSDHETGGLVCGARKTANLKVLASQTVSENALTTSFRRTFGLKNGRCTNVPEWEAVKDFFRQNLGMWGDVKVDAQTDERFHKLYEQTFFHGEEDVVSLYAVNSRIVSDAIEYVNSQASISWASSSHSGSAVGLYVKGERALDFATCRDNVDIPRKIAEVAGIKIK